MFSLSLISTVSSYSHNEYINEFTKIEITKKAWFLPDCSY